MNNCNCVSDLYEDEVLDKVMDRNETAVSQNNKTGVVMV